MTMLRNAVLLAVPMSLCACASTGDFQTHYAGTDGRLYGNSLNVGPMNASDPRLADWRFYMDDDSTPRWMLMTGAPNR
ncbi:MAG: hypothetical protein JO133_02200 [Burkholderiaceae bacterium]|nr:hypothetical protein [Burkholderiaceae bacterium]